MPRPRKPARLYLRPDTGEWIIRDAGKDIRTGHRGVGGREPAEAALRRYLANREPEHRRAALPDEITVGEVLALYAHGPGAAAADPERIGYAIRALAVWWGDKTCEEIRGSTCREYAEYRAAPRRLDDGTEKPGVGVGTVRRELGTLQAALNYAHVEGVLRHPVKAALPERPAPKDRWMTRSEAARLLRASSPHLRRFVLIGLYTGTRAAAILSLRWTTSTDSGWVDLVRGVLHRRGGEERQTKKRRSSARIPRQLLAHMRRWSRDGGSHVVSWKGEPVARIRKALAAALRRAGLSDDITPHVLRHTAITWAMQRGMPIPDASDYFGVSPEVLRSVYWHHSPEHQRRAVDIIERR